MSSLDRARTLVANAQRIAALTGAGISTASGIQDFRGPQGRWTNDPDAEKISTLSWYLGDLNVRRKAWQARVFSPHWEAQPNPGHLALVELERQGKLAGIITQNTDGLHGVAGNSPALIHEVHGNARRWQCEDCPATGDMAEMVARVHAGEDDPRCPACGGITRATVILFEEALDPAVLGAAERLANECDLLVAIGTSLTVYPVAGFVPYVVGRGVPVVIINGQATPFDDYAEAVIHDPIEQVLPQLVAAHEGSAE